MEDVEEFIGNEPATMNTDMFSQKLTEMLSEREIMTLQPVIPLEKGSKITVSDLLNLR
jgi:hypothetical protein